MQAAPARREGRHLFPPDTDEKKRRQRRIKGHPLEKQIAFRPPPDLARYIEAEEKGGRTKTAVVLRMLFIARDMVTELGIDWWEVEREAAQLETTPGKVLGLWAKEAIDKRRSKRK